MPALEQCSRRAGRDREDPSLIAARRCEPERRIRLRQAAGMLVGKHAEAKGGPIFQSLLANSGILEGEGRVLHPVEVKTAATVGADVVKNFACLEGLRGYEVGFGHVICQTKDPYPIIRGVQAVPVWAI